MGVAFALARPAAMRGAVRGRSAARAEKIHACAVTFVSRRARVRPRWGPASPATASAAPAAGARSCPPCGRVVPHGSRRAPRAPPQGAERPHADSYKEVPLPMSPRRSRPRTPPPPHYAPRPSPCGRARGIPAALRFTRKSAFMALFAAGVRRSAPFRRRGAVHAVSGAPPKVAGVRVPNVRL